VAPSYSGLGGGLNADRAECRRAECRPQLLLLGRNANSSPGVSMNQTKRVALKVKGKNMTCRV